MADKPLVVGPIGNVNCKFCAESDWIDAFTRLGHQVLPLDEASATRQSVLRLAELCDFVMLVCSKETISPSWMREASELCLTVAWHADLFHGLYRGGKWKQSPMWACDLAFTADGGHQKEWEAMGVEHHWLLPGIRKEWTQLRARARSGFVCDVAFVGNNGSTYHAEWGYRKELLEALRVMCKRNNWRFLNPGGGQRRVGRGVVLNRFYASSKVVVGDSLCLDRRDSLYWSDRVYETTGRKGLLVMPQIDALHESYEGKLPAYQWGDWDDLESVVAGFLADREARERVVEETHRLTVRDHTYDSRVESLLRVVKQRLR